MAKRFYTSDFHLGFSGLLEIEKWPFKSIEKHDQALIRSCRERAKPEDTIIHVGDLASVGMDRHNGLDSRGLDVKPAELLSGIEATFVNIRGNHDVSNKVKSLCDCMRTSLGKRYPNVSVSHYPSYDRRARGQYFDGDIHVCGHVHGKWKYCLDLDHSVLNVNVGCMAWRFQIVSEDELIQYITKVLSHRPDKLYRCRTVDGKLRFYREEKEGKDNG